MDSILTSGVPDRPASIRTVNIPFIPQGRPTLRPAEVVIHKTLYVFLTVISICAGVFLTV